jgi:hypothetical protein
LESAWTATVSKDGDAVPYDAPQCCVKLTASAMTAKFMQKAVKPEQSNSIRDAK